jgi:hypothetical protein
MLLLYVLSLFAKVVGKNEFVSNMRTVQSHLMRAGSGHRNLREVEKREKGVDEILHSPTKKFESATSGKPTRGSKRSFQHDHATNAFWFPNIFHNFTEDAMRIITQRGRGEPAPLGWEAETEFAVFRWQNESQR